MTEEKKDVGSQSVFGGDAGVERQTKRDSASKKVKSGFSAIKKLTGNLKTVETPQAVKDAQTQNA